MLFSKTFGYALRGILYIALVTDEKEKVHVDEIAEKLAVPRHFMGKILKRLVKHDLLQSTKGPAGGFTLSDITLATPLWNLIEITDGLGSFTNCVLRLQECNSENPCPLHSKIEATRVELRNVFTNTTIGELLHEDKQEFIRSIATFDVTKVFVKDPVY